MKCPNCFSENKTSVLDSRVTSDGSIRRRRECSECGYRFTTYETVEDRNIYVIKKDGTIQEYDKEKLEKGILTALHKRRVSPKNIQKLINDIDKDIISREQHEISVKEIGEIILEHLKKYDQVAYIRFASVYRDYNSVDEFITEIKNIK